MTALTLVIPEAVKPFKDASKMKCTAAEADALLTRALTIALEAETSSRRDRAVFFSGAAEKKAAHEFCNKNPGHRNVCATDALQQFNDLHLFKYSPPLTIKEIYDIGDIISERFAREASGNVTIFAGPSCKVHGTFLRVELPALLKNEAVTTINGNPKAQYQYLLDDTVKVRRDIEKAVKLEK